MKLIAIDFETANYEADSACALGIVSIENGKIARQAHQLIRPPRNEFIFTYIHGITWNDVKRQKTFGEVWDDFRGFWDGADYLVAHNAPFDRKVLATCCAGAGREPPPSPFICTVQVARSHWNFRPANLPSVCERLGIALKHHDAASDALACATILVRAMAEGFSPHAGVVGRSRQRVNGD